MAKRRWIRLDADWDESEWIDGLDGAVAGLWPRLLCWVKIRGTGGRCRRPSRSVLARRWRVPVEHVAALETAAIEDGAIHIDDGDIVVENWAKYQEPDTTAAARKRRQRSRQHGDAGVSRKSRRDTRDRGRDRGVTGRDPSRDRDIDRDTDIDPPSETETQPPPSRDAREAAPPEEAQEEERVETTDMRIALSGLLDRIPEPTTRRRVSASARLLMSGDDMKAWETPKGEGVPWPDRLRLWKLALAKLEADAHYGSGDLRSNLRYVVKCETGEPLPSRRRSPDSEAGQVRTEYPGAGRTSTAELRPITHDPKAEAEAERREQEAIAAWMRSHPERREAMKAEIEAEMRQRPEWAEMDVRFLTPAVEAEVRKRVRLEMESAA